jgi:hypothetical protein
VNVGMNRLRLSTTNTATWSCVIVATFSILFMGSCRRDQEPRVTKSALQRCIAKTGYEGAGDASPAVMAAARACAEKYITKPTVQLWAQKPGTSVPLDVRRDGDRVFVEAFLNCAKQKGMEVEVEQAGGGSIRIKARNGRNTTPIDSTDPAFLACTNSAEKAEHDRLLPFL